MTKTCKDCGRDVNPQSANVWSEVRGWEQKRAAGGTNAVALREPTGRWMCGDCMRKQKSGIAPDQGGLFSG